MKKIKIILIILLLSHMSEATVRILNNNSVSGQYSSWTSVQTASAIFDTVYVIGSNVSYGNITITKPLTIIGTGHNPQKQNPLVSQFGIVTFQVWQLTLIGIKCTQVYFTYGVNPQFAGSVTLTAEYCKISDGIIIGNSNFDVYCNLKYNIIGPEGVLSSAINIVVNNALHGNISNNIFNGSLNVYSYAYATSHVDNCNMSNNIFIAANYGANPFFLFPTIYLNSTFDNNLIHGYNDDNIDSVNSTVSCRYNLIYPAVASFDLPNGSGNFTGNPLYVNVPCIGANCPFSNSYDYHLTATSPGHNEGSDGRDLGPYGGNSGINFNTYGEPAIPQIRQMNLPASILSGYNFNVNIFTTVK